MQKKRRIALVCEGESTEKQIIGNLFPLFFANSEVVKVFLPAKGNLRMIADQLRADKNLNAYDLIKDLNDETRRVLAKYQKKDFTYIFLFFDLDAHAWRGERDEYRADDVRMLLDIFNDETEAGKLFLSYPMVEAIRHLMMEGDFCSCGNCFSLFDLGKKYKGKVTACADFINIPAYGIQQWQRQVDFSMCKANCLVRDEMRYPTWDQFKNELDQKEIFEAQMKKFLPNRRVGILSAFPLFLGYYFGEEKWSMFFER